jgi:HK97 family phage major capsid protein
MRRDDLRRLKEQRVHALAEADEIHKRSERDQRSLTADEQSRWDELIRDTQRLTLEIDAAQDAPLEPTGSGSGTTYRSAAIDPTPAEREFAAAIKSVAKGDSRALSTAISTSPGALSNVLFDRLRAASVVLSTGIRTLTTEADAVTYPAITADAAPAWTAEAATISPSDPTFGTVVAAPHKLAALTQVSNELIDDSDPSIVDVLNDHLIKVVSLKLDAGLLEGSGTPPEPVGLKNISGSSRSRRARTAPPRRSTSSPTRSRSSRA